MTRSTLVLVNLAAVVLGVLSIVVAWAWCTAPDPGRYIGTALGVFAILTGGLQIGVVLRRDRRQAVAYRRPLFLDRQGHFSSSRPYVELPKVSGRPGAGMVTDERPVFLSPSLSATTAQAAENFRRNFTAALGIPLPVAVPRPFELFGKCPNCWTVDMHLLGDRDTTTDTTASGSSVCRECRACGHIWKERLDD